MSVTVKSTEDDFVGLKREIGLVSATNFLLINIVVQGVFITPGKILQETGSIGMALTVYLFCGVFSLMNCLPFVELSTVVPKSGSIYTYLLCAFGDLHKFFGGLPAFVYFWINYVIISPCMTAVNVQMFAEYSYKILQIFLPENILSHETTAKYTLGVLSLVLVCAVNCLSVKLYVKSQNFFIYLIMGSIIFTIGCGCYLFISGKAYQFDVGFKGTNWSVEKFNQALFLGLYAYDGGWSVTGITEELKNPEITVLYSIILSLAISTAVYLLLNVAFLSALTQEELASSTTVIADFMTTLFGQTGEILAILIVCICLVTINLSVVFYISRQGYVAAREGHIADILCYIHKKWQTPAPAVTLQVFLALVYYLLGQNITLLINMCSFFNWLSYTVTMIIVFVFRKKMPSANITFRVWSVVPVTVAVVSSYIVFESLIVTPNNLLIIFGVCLACILALYYIFIYKHFRIKFYDKVQRHLSNCLRLVPPSDQTICEKKNTPTKDNEVSS